MSNQFAVALPTATVQRSNFNRSHKVTLTGDADVLIPILGEEILPGDTVNLKTSVVGRMFSRLKQSIMDNLYVDLMHVFVPMRLVWDNWQPFMGERPTPSSPDPSTYSIPTIDFTDGSNAPSAAGLQSNYDYLGIPPNYGAVGNPVPVSALYFRAIAKFWDDWCRDQNLQDPRLGSTGNGPDKVALYRDPFPRGKMHDYFTSMLLAPYKGIAPTLSLGTSAPVVGTFYGPSVAATLPVKFNEGTGTYNNDLNAASTGTNIAARFNNVTTLGTLDAQGQVGIGTFEMDVTALGSLTADLSAAQAITLNAFREFTAINQLLELDNRGGTRYTEIIRSHFQVISPDARLQRAEYLGGNTAPVNIHTVADTSTANLGAIGGAFGTFAAQAGFVHSFVEHGILLSFACVRADLTYQQGISRQFQRQTRYDFFWPTFAHLGEQAVKTSEIFADDSASDNDAIIGYQERYAEYRYAPNRIAGKFRSDVSGSIDIFHLAQDFATAPALDENFIKYATPMSRVLAVTTEPAFLIDVKHDLQHVRPMPVYSVPGLTRI
nr:MAG: major capsid protein [Microvirus sp.]